METYIAILTLLCGIMKVILTISLVIGITISVTEIILTILNKELKWPKKRDWLFITVGVIFLFSLLGTIFSEGILNNLLTKRNGYETGIEKMSDGLWYEASVAFDEGGDYNHSDILRDYCYYVYLSEEHPDWVPWMGLNEITGECN